MGELLRPVTAKRCALDLRLRMQRRELGDGVGNEACVNSYRLTKESFNVKESNALPIVIVNVVTLDKHPIHHTLRQLNKKYQGAVRSLESSFASKLWRNRAAAKSWSFPLEPEIHHRVQAKLFIEFYNALNPWRVSLPLCLHIFHPKGLIDRAPCAKHPRPARLRSSCKVADVTGPVIVRLPSRNSWPLT